MPRTPLPCPRCGAPMNRHAEKLVDRTGSEPFDPILGGVLEEHHLCRVCGHIESRRVLH
jgi:hypothetical protein